MVFIDALVQTGAPVEAAADAQDGGEEGAGSQTVTDLYGQLDRLRAERHPCEGSGD